MRRQLALGTALLAVVSSLCLAGLRAIDEKLAQKEKKSQS